MTTFLAAGDEAWLPRIQFALTSSKFDNEAAVQSVVELFNLAEQDYLCSPIPPLLSRGKNTHSRVNSYPYPGNAHAIPPG